MMTTRRDFLGATVALAAVPVAAASAWAETPGATGDAQWRRRLSADQFAVLRESGTERPFSSSLLKEKRSGTFACAGCARLLFSSNTKYDSHTGWPSFWAPLTGAVSEQSDNSLGMPRNRRELQPVRRSSRPRLQRRTETDGLALLHERRRHEVPARRGLVDGARLAGAHVAPI